MSSFYNSANRDTVWGNAGGEKGKTDDFFLVALAQPIYAI
jgi:hypothetical protein